MTSPRFFRAPYAYGALPTSGDRKVALARSADLVFGWSQDISDWNVEDISTLEKLLERIDTLIPSGFGAAGHILLFHETPMSVSANPDHLPAIVGRLRKNCPQCSFRGLDYCFEKSQAPGVLEARARVEARLQNPKTVPPQEPTVLKTCPIPNEEVVFLTFDDGPFHQTAKHAEALLYKLNVSATYFWVGDKLDNMAWPDGSGGGIVAYNAWTLDEQKLADAKLVDVVSRRWGHSIGAHTQAHGNMGGGDLSSRGI